MRQNNIVFYDYETTGLKLDSLQITQVAAVGICGKTLTFTKNDIFNSYIKIELDENECREKGLEPLTQKIMDLTHVSPEILEAAPTQDVVYSKFKDFVKRYNDGGNTKFQRPIAAGFNIRNYDHPITDRWSNENNDVDADGKNQLFHCMHMLDLKDVEYLTLENISSINSISFDNLRTLYGFSKDGAHNALVDVVQGSLLLCRKMNYFRGNCKKRYFENSMANVDITQYLED